MRILKYALLICVLALTCTAFAEDSAESEKIRTEVYAPTCEQGGYTLHIDNETGEIRITDDAPPLGHSFGEWQTEEGGKFRVCGRCGFIDRKADAVLPEIRFSGSMAGMNKEECIVMPVRYTDGEQSFSCYAGMTYQGHSTLNLPKHNYTMRLYDDTELFEKHRLSFNGWQEEHKYILKACYEDTTCCRNLACARLWGQMAATRENLPERLAETSNYGAVNGFPVSVWLEDEFLGVYAMNLHKDDDLYGMRSGTRETVMIANGQTSDESLFKAPALFIEDITDWELEYCGTKEDRPLAMDSFNALIFFINESGDEAFRAQLGEHMDVNGAIDYLIFLYATGLNHNYAKDLVLINYGDDFWIPTVYDMDYAFGLYGDCADFLPTLENGVWSTGTDSRLWDRLMNAFAPEIKQRYRELRESVLTEENMLATVDALLELIPPDMLEKDMAVYPDRVRTDREDIAVFIGARLNALDAAFEKGGC